MCHIFCSRTFFTVDVLTSHSRKSTGATNNFNESSIPLSLPTRIHNSVKAQKVTYSTVHSLHTRNAIIMCLITPAPAMTCPHVCCCGKKRRTYCHLTYSNQNILPCFVYHYFFPHMINFLWTGGLKADISPDIFEVNLINVLIDVQYV